MQEALGQHMAHQQAVVERPDHTIGGPQLAVLLQPEDLAVAARVGLAEDPRHRRRDASTVVGRQQVGRQEGGPEPTIERLRIPYRHGGEVARILRRRSEEHTSELQSLMRISYAGFCLKKKKRKTLSTRTTL